MDILAHALWSGAAAQAVNLKQKRNDRIPRLKVASVVFWGVFPDLFAFTIPFLGLLYNLTFKGLSLSALPGPSASEPPPSGTRWFFTLAGKLYSFGHSAVVFAVIFLLVLALVRKPVWELFGWLFHILIDVPTHSYHFYPTPIFWPVSTWKFNGISWAEPWFMIANYGALLIVFLILRKPNQHV